MMKRATSCRSYAVFVESVGSICHYLPTYKSRFGIRTDRLRAYGTLFFVQSPNTGCLGGDVPLCLGPFDSTSGK